MADPTVARLSIKEAAARLGVTPETIRTWVRLRKLPFYKIGKRVVFLASDIDRFFDSRRVPSQAEARNGTVEVPWLTD